MYNTTDNFSHNAFLIIPAYIADNPNIDDSTAVLFGRLNALSNQKGYCFASDEYLAQLSKVSEGEIQKRLKILENEGFIKRFTKKKGMKWERKIYTCNNYSQIISTKDSYGVFEGIHTEPFEQSIRRTYINKNNNNIKENLSKERVKKDADALSASSEKKENPSFNFLCHFKERIAYLYKQLGIKLPCVKYIPKNVEYIDRLFKNNPEKEINEVFEYALNDSFWIKVINNPYSFMKNYDKIKLNMVKFKIKKKPKKFLWKGKKLPIYLGGEGKWIPEHMMQEKTT